MKIGKSKYPPKQRPKPPGVEGAPAPRIAGDPMPEDAKPGRPSKYRPEYCQALIDYFRNAEPWRIHYNNAGGAQVIPVDKVPSLNRFAINLGVHLSTLSKWAEDYADFKEAIAIGLCGKHAFHMESGTAGIGSSFNAQVLKCEHGMVEPKTETVESKPIEIRFVDAVRKDD